MDNILVIGDVAGQYDALLRLLNQIPAEEKKRIIFVGDLIDRGPKPIEVVDFVKKNAECIYGNHEDMFVDYYSETNRYQDGTWESNGGYITIEAYTEAGKDKLKEHLDYIKKLPWYIETDDLFISHGIWSRFSELEQALQPFEQTFSGARGEHNLIWNRDNFIKRDKFQIYGHNGRVLSTPHSICIDGQRDKPQAVCAYNTETKKIYRASF